MLEKLAPQKPDALLALIKLYAADDRADKIDLGVGVYRDNQGNTPVFKAIKAAEQRLFDTQDSKSYLGPEGDMGMVCGLLGHILGEDLAKDLTIDGLQTPGGTGAVRLAADTLYAAGARRIWLGTPSWPNHAPIFTASQFEVLTYRHMDVATQSLDMEALLSSLYKAEDGDVVLLHGCCHNPTGVDYTAEQWAHIVEIMAEKRLFPLVDFAYHGLGQGFEEDSAGLKTVLARLPQAMIAYSCDKNFGMYRDRVGALYAVAQDDAVMATTKSNMAALARANWSMPPDHGGAAVRIILDDAELTQMWRDEVAEMRSRMRWVRDTLAAAGTAGSVDFAPLATQNGMFSMLPLSPEQIQALRDDHAIYMAGSGRINIAGLTEGNIGKFIEAVAAVSG
ncbi:amino acid aminotransferase [Alterisphingorhabdus coralli]|uniref:Amino acid aminotransferase n=1 Tax=Alterisphingorhabdus coralli TaxID=3071408 RepID=A0AA97FAA9_9SPHN|nr:amino acid aminotransferase [Parasphingorhabdus sp. SCSIO 66989]WOE75400.1 amino acid aminotransferase [Parasphingorhabdus sp. SCSIO 66989]